MARPWWGWAGTRVPAILAAKRERVPVVLQEQNAVAGLANRVLSRLAATVALGFADAGSFFPRRRVVVTGNPVREEILAVRVNREALAAEARSRFDLDPGRSTVVIVGGPGRAAPGPGDRGRLRAPGGQG